MEVLYQLSYRGAARIAVPLLREGVAAQVTGKIPKSHGYVKLKKAPPENPPPKGRVARPHSLRR